jgi:hypothetical protein
VSVRSHFSNYESVTKKWYLDNLAKNTSSFRDQPHREECFPRTIVQSSS